MAIYNSEILTSNTQLASGSGVRAITTVIVCNVNEYNPSTPTVGLAHLSLYAVPSGSSIGNPQLIVNKLPIPAGETVTFDQEKMVLDSGDELYAVSDIATTLVATVSTLVV